jgi:uncharacterized protein YciI
MPDTTSEKSMFVLIARYEDLDAVQQHADAHRALVQRLYDGGWILTSGPLVGEPGGLIVMRAEDEDELERVFFSQDAFRQHGVVEYTVARFAQSDYPRRSPSFDQFSSGPTG